jgi:hypothetical protein
MAGSRPKVDFIQLDERNALIFNAPNTEYIMAKIREATTLPGKRTELYAEMARRFHIDTDKMNMAVIKYVDRLKRERTRRRSEDETAQYDKEQKEALALDERVLMAALCREVGHRFVTITLSQKRGCRECQRCGKHESRYNI